MSRQFDGVDDQIASSAPATAAPLTMACWFVADDATNIHTLMSVGVSGSSDNRFTLHAAGSVAGDPVRLQAFVGTANNCTTSTGYTAGVWTHACGVVASATDRRAFINGGSKSTQTASKVPAGVNQLLLGRLHDAANPAAGQIAEAAVWNAALTDAEVASLARGASPLTVRPDAIIYYAPLAGNASPEPEIVGALTLTASGTTKGTSHPARAGRNRTLNIGLGAAGAGDTTAPNTTITAGPAHGGRTLDNTPTFTFTSDEGVSLPVVFERRIDGGSWTTVTSPDTLSTLSEGSHTVDYRSTDSVGNVDATPASRTFTVDTDPFLDVFLVAGQSNAEGRGSSASSTVVTEGEGYEWNGSTLLPIADPVGGATTGSAWPAFCDAYYDATTGRIAVIVEQATGGTGQAAASVPDSIHWDVGGTLRSPAVTAYNSAVTAIAAAYPAATVTARGVLWVQGERDAQAIDAASITKATYKAAFQTMLAYFRANVAAGLQFYVSQTGYDAGSADTTGFQQVRAAQQEVTDADPLTCMAFAGAVLFPTTGKANGLHYTQTGYNEMGAAMAASVASPAYTSTAALNAVARATATGTKNATGTAAITAVATATATGSKDAAPAYTGTATLTARAAITATGTKAATGTATINAVARLIASGSAPSQIVGRLDHTGTITSTLEAHDTIPA